MRKFMSDFRALLSAASPLAVSLLFLSVVGMNLLANKSIDTGVEWLALDCGILFSWLTFLTMDILTQSYGPGAATMLSFAALLANLLMAGIFYAASMIPGVWSESFVDGSAQILNAALDNTFGGTWFVLAGSSVAFISSAVLNNFLNYSVGRHIKSAQGFWNFALRAYVSTITAQFADNMIFALLVSRPFFGWTMTQCFTCALTGAVFELLFEVIFSPLGYGLARGMLCGGLTVREA
ncbi:MAG: VUT family protein [Synergistaceae bacterium]|nr:VUT family protein [Synergistaceae bacterium]